jgi:hypothetical protein
LSFPGLANRRLQPLGHVSVAADMPEIGDMRKRMDADLRRREVSTAIRAAQYGTGWRDRQRWISSGISGGASNDDLRQQPQPHAGKPPGAGERWRKSFSGYPLTTGCGNRILYLEAPNCRWRFESFKPKSRRRPLSQTPAPLRRPHGNVALSQTCIRHHRVDVKSPIGSEHTAPRRGYFFFFAATLRFAGAFFFAAVFAFVAFFTILPS